MKSTIIFLCAAAVAAFCALVGVSNAAVPPTTDASDVVPQPRIGVIEFVGGYILGKIIDWVLTPTTVYAPSVTPEDTPQPNLATTYKCVFTGTGYLNVRDSPCGDPIGKLHTPDSGEYLIVKTSSIDDSNTFCGDCGMDSYKACWFQSTEGWWAAANYLYCKPL